MNVQSYDLTPEEIEKIDRELQESIGVEIEHEPFLSDNFSELMMETETEA